MRRSVWLSVTLCLAMCTLPLQADMRGSGDRSSSEKRAETKQGLRVGVMCALPMELGALTEEMDEAAPVETVGMRRYRQGDLWGIDSIVATSRVGKVAAATTATHLIESGQVDAVVYLGVAGAIDERLSQGDIVIGERLVQYDIDSRPFCPQFTIPLLNIAELESDTRLVAMGLQAAEDYLQANGQQGCTGARREGARLNQVYVGLIGTGDRFVSDASERAELKAAIPSLLAVDMEGAAVAQVCYEHDIPFVVIRTVSDTCDGDAAMDCLKFLQEVAPVYTRELLHGLYRQMTQVN